MTYKERFAKGDIIKKTKYMGKYIVEGKPMEDKIDEVTVIGITRGGKLKVRSNRLEIGYAILPTYEEDGHGKLEKVGA